MSQPVGRNAKCPCGSGKKFKHCCLNHPASASNEIPVEEDLDPLLGMDWDDSPTNLESDVAAEEKLFPNQHLEHIEHGIVEAMRSSGIDPALIYAFEKTGMLVSDENRDQISPDDFAKWEAAVAEFREQNTTPATSMEAHFATRDKSTCWSCDKPLPQNAMRCLHCEASVDDAPKPEDAAMLMELLKDMDPAMMEEMRQLALSSDSGEDFVNRIMVGSCPVCESDDTGDCENDPEIEDPCLGRCFACSQLFCTDCEELFKNPADAKAHKCPMWDDDDDEDIEF